MNLIISLIMKLFSNNKTTIKEFNPSITQELEKTDLVQFTQSIPETSENCELNVYRTQKVLENVLFRGKWKAQDMSFVQLWNNNAYEPEKRNYTRYMMIFRTPDYRSVGDENGGWDNGIEESISLTVNVEEGKVFLEDYTQASKIFENKRELELFIQQAQNKFDNELDMGKGTAFIFGWGGSMPCLYEYENPNIEYIPIVFPDNEKFRVPNYRKKVEWSLIKKGAIMIKPKRGKQYLAVIQRKNKPRNLKPFLRYIVKNDNVLNSHSGNYCC